jgi:hypothetical protein
MGDHLRFVTRVRKPGKENVVVRADGVSADQIKTPLRISRYKFHYQHHGWCYLQWEPFSDQRANGRFLGFSSAAFIRFYDSCPLSIMQGLLQVHQRLSSFIAPY